MVEKEGFLRSAHGRMLGGRILADNRKAAQN
jgi:hypothetical protein